MRKSQFLERILIAITNKTFLQPLSLQLQAGGSDLVDTLELMAQVGTFLDIVEENRFNEISLKLKPLKKLSASTFQILVL